MTSEEPDEMNALCLQIQQQKTYEKFEELANSMSSSLAGSAGSEAHRLVYFATHVRNVA